ncbi:MAG TPA: hypothetical protein VGW36_05550, partial [Pyrinomonadaceae bacterium]|nr:hypothetical protein [Pyrinomonadaceae bacterium]
EQVDRRVHDDPHYVDEVPVDSGDLDTVVVLRGVVPAKGAHGREREQRQPDEHVRAVQPGEPEEDGRERAFVEGEADPRVLDHLREQEREAHGERPPTAEGPRGNEPPYPILYNEDNQRREGMLAALTRLAPQSDTSGPLVPRLRPVTATIESLLPNANSPLYLPKLGTEPVMNEEETRESLRRFIRDWRELIGSDPAKLSLVERSDNPDGSKVAKYEQRPFRFPIRGNFGKLEIRFTSDRRVVYLSSTCIPEAERMQPALAALTPKLQPEDAVKKVRDNPITYVDAQGNSLNLSVPASSEVSATTPVVYIRPSPSADSLEFHLAWEVQISNAPVKFVYVDSISGDVIAAA